MFRRLICRIFGHDKIIEDHGGVLYELCKRCPWVGRSIEYLPFVTYPCCQNCGDLVYIVDKIIKDPAHAAGVYRFRGAECERCGIHDGVWSAVDS